LIFAALPDFALRQEQIVQIPVSESIPAFFQQFTFPDFSQLANPDIYVIAITIAVVASLETLLCLEATDKLDPFKRISPANRELKAQGIGNIVSGLIGGLPVTQVIVRSSTNIQSGGRTKMSAIIHGFILLGTAMLIPNVLNLIPLASLAAILFLVGYKLAKPALFKSMYKQGLEQFIPFVVTILGIVFTDLLVGIGIGMVVAIMYILYRNYMKPYSVHTHPGEEDDVIILTLAEEVTFLNKAGIMHSLDELHDGAKVVIDKSKTVSMHQDVVEILDDFLKSAEYRDIDVRVIEREAGGRQAHPMKKLKEIVKDLSTSNGQAGTPAVKT
jgi:MFS superfamily sulfate permease-like transporter